ncbi:PepSY domain-containing protein [Granulicella arctica]|uniref:PepSY domain-containing protein n=1 Tax=Granulicella arctica TaxID=940613 RepID=UPI0032B244AC
MIHLYLGVFIAPALIFFAITGGLQTFNLHETTRGSSYKPPAILVKLGQLHKKQTLVVPVRKPQPPAALASGSPKGDKPHDGAPDAPAGAGANAKPTDAPVTKVKNLLPMKLFFLLVSLGLFTSTLTGLYMSYKYIRNTKLITALLIAGIVIPVLLTFL